MIPGVDVLVADQAHEMIDFMLGVITELFLFFLTRGEAYGTFLDRPAGAFGHLNGVRTGVRPVARCSRLSTGAKRCYGVALCVN